MSTVMLTDVFVNKGFENDPAIRVSESGKAASFQVGERVYDKKAENDHRYINYDVKAFGEMIERIKKMGLKEGSRVHLVGRLDEESWNDKETGKGRRKLVIILEKIDYGYLPKENNGGQNAGGGGQNGYGAGGQNGGGQNGYNGGYGSQGGYAGPAQGMPVQNGQMPQQGAMPNYQQPMPQQGQMPQGFTGYENYGQNNGGGNPYFGNQG